MVLMKLLSNENGRCRYSYQPEKQGKEGVLAYDRNTEEVDIELLAEKDVKSTFYRNHAFRMIINEIDDLPKERLLTWY